MLTVRTLCVVALVAGLWWAYQLGISDSFFRSNEVGLMDSQLGFPRTGFKEEGAILSTQGHDQDAGRTIGADEVEQILESVNPSNDWLVRVDQNMTDYLLVSSDSTGLTVTNHNPKLGVVRFSVTNPLLALPLLNRFLSEDTISPNHPLRSPLPPRNYSMAEESYFADSFIDWLGGDRTRSGFGKGVKVALLDSGVDLNHPSLAGSSVEQMYDQVGLLVASETKNSHGTALASVMAGNTETYQGIAPGCEILSYPVIDESGRADTYTVAQAILHAVEDGAEVINLSLGAEQSSAVLRDAVSYAINQDVVVVAAVGNEGIGLVNYPAAYDGVIGVTSIGTGGKVASFSNYGKEVDVAAPGVGVLTAWESGEFANFSGTSVSSAIVSAAIAVERARFPHLTNSQIQELVFSHTMEAEKPGHDEVSGYGVVSLARLENKNNPVYSDPALVGYHFENSPSHGGTIPFEVVFQNQGNTWQDNLELEVRYLGTNKRLPINNFAPGEVRSEKFYVQGSSVKNALEISAKLIVPKDVADSRPENNDRKSVIRF